MKTTKKLLVLACSLVIIFSLFDTPAMHAASATEKNIVENALYVAPGARGKGTFNDPMDLEMAIMNVKNGQTIYMLEGTYKYTYTITIHEVYSGKENNYKTLSAYPGAKVILDFSQLPCNNNGKGVVLAANYWHLYGITIQGAGDNGMLLTGDYNIIEMCLFENNRDTGLQLSRYKSYQTFEEWPSYNYILNCTSRNNCDPDGEDADGFAPKLTCGEGNVFNGCMAYNNVDDGWDCYAKPATGPIGKVTLINCIAFRNGQTEDGTFTVDSDGNGFKLGGGGIGTPHTVINCLAFENKRHGFIDNNNPTALTLINCTSVNSALGNYIISQTVDANCVNILSYNTTSVHDFFWNAYGNYLTYTNGRKWVQIDSYLYLNSREAQSKQIDIGVQASDFITTEAPPVGTDFHTAWRNEDGSINVHGFATINPDSKYATFSTDGKASGARFDAGYMEYFSPASANIIKEAALAGVVPDFSLIPTPTPTNTPTPTPKPTNTPTPTPTNTPTPTSTPTPTPTNTPTPTSTPTPTPTNTPTPTSTPVPTPTNTPIPTSTSTPLPTNTQPVTVTSTSKPEATATPKASITPVEQVSEITTKDGFTEYIPLIITVAVVAVVAVGVTFIIVKKRK